MIHLNYNEIIIFHYSVNEYRNVYNNNVLATSLWDSTTNEKLNQVQLQAIESALKHKFQLIQGPPGI